MVKRTEKVIKTHFSAKRFKYNGYQIRSRWAYKTFGFKGDNIVSFIGECDIAPKYMVDLEDLEKGARIYSPLMLHFIIEHFDLGLDKAILYQRLLSTIIKEIIERKIRRLLVRDGDDLFDGRAKLSISIATQTPVSSKIHFGINIETQGTPVLTKGLKDYKIQPGWLAREAMRNYAKELSMIAHARTKVKWVK